MNRDDIIRRAHEADCLDDQHYGTVWANKLERFAHLVAAAEREAWATAWVAVEVEKLPIKQKIRRVRKESSDERV